MGNRNLHGQNRSRKFIKPPTKDQNVKECSLKGLLTPTYPEASCSKSVLGQSVLEGRLILLSGRPDDVTMYMAGGKRGVPQEQ